MAQRLPQAVEFRSPLPLREGMRIQFRSEFFNVLNHANFNIPGFTLGGPGFGAISSARAPRTTQVAVRFSF